MHRHQHLPVGISKPIAVLKPIVNQRFGDLLIQIGPGVQKLVDAAGR